MARSTRPWRSWRARASPTPSAYLFGVQMADIEFDIETYEPLAVLKPAMTRAQAEKTLDMLAAAEPPSSSPMGASSMPRRLRSWSSSQNCSL